MTIKSKVVNTHIHKARNPLTNGNGFTTYTMQIVILKMVTNQPTLVCYEHGFALKLHCGPRTPEYVAGPNPLKARFDLF
jgi:hypothetical protein